MLNKYEYVPNFYDFNILENKNISYEEFLNMQLKYRESLETLLEKYISFEEIDKFIENIDVKIPLLVKDDFNFYHKFSTLNSKYVYVRNNYHIERLEEAEIQEVRNAIINNTVLSEEFILKIIPKVIFEEYDTICYGVLVPHNFAKAHSLTLEFAFDIMNVENFETESKIKDRMNKAFSYIRDNLKPHLNIEITQIFYDGADFVYRPKD